MTGNICKIFAPWRGPHLKWLFSTFFQVMVYLVDTQNFRVTWQPLHVFCKYLCKYWSYLINKYLAFSFGSCLSCKNRFRQFSMKIEVIILIWIFLFYFLESDMKTHSALSPITSSSKYSTSSSTTSTSSSSGAKRGPEGECGCRDEGVALHWEQHHQ